MIHFDHWELKNGLKVILNEDKNTPMVCVNLMYHVGAKDEDPNHTGLAHLFEHLMFSGSKNATNFDELVQKAGGENNAFTSNDITNYYITLPAENLELALHLEADRMQHLNLNQNSLDVQKKVVIEEFKQRYFNQPYGDVWLHLRPLRYLKHPYQWPTIGKSIAQIEAFDLPLAEQFYRRYYAPNNAVLSISGNISKSTCKQLVDQYFAAIPASEIVRPDKQEEEPQTEIRIKEHSENVPFDSFYMAFIAPKKASRSFHVGDIVSDILGGGATSRFYQRLVKERELLGEVNVYLTGEEDNGMFIISGKLSKGITFSEVEDAIWNLLNELVKNGLTEGECLKVINKKLTAEVYGDMQNLNKAIKTGYYHLIGKLDEVNDTVATLQSITEQEVIDFVVTELNADKCCLLRYKAQ